MKLRHLICAHGARLARIPCRRLRSRGPSPARRRGEGGRRSCCPLCYAAVLLPRLLLRRRRSRAVEFRSTAWNLTSPNAAEHGKQGLLIRRSLVRIQLGALGGSRSARSTRSVVAGVPESVGVVGERCGGS